MLIPSSRRRADGTWPTARRAARASYGRPDDEDVTLYARTLLCIVCSPLYWRKTELTLLVECILGTPALQRDTWTWATSIFERRMSAPSALPSWIHTLASVWESAGLMVPYLDMLNHGTGTA